MPIYEYRCKKCNNGFEALIRSAREESLVECPHCEQGEIERVLSSFSVTYSGGTSSSGANCGPKRGQSR